MAMGISIHVGLNRIDPVYYGAGNELSGCINDARDMQDLAVKQGFQTTLMVDEEATAEAVISAIAGTAHSLRPGDMLLLTYSGHGSQVPDKNGDEPDGKDETWCLYDRMLVDDELNALWSQFKAGVRICMLSDSCHSGTVARVQQTRELMKSPAFNGDFRELLTPTSASSKRADVKRGATTSRSTADLTPPSSAPEIRFRLLPDTVAARAYEKSKALYDSIQRVIGDRVKAAIDASVILISGCQDNQLSADGVSNGLFTQRLKEVWRDGSFQGDYSAFHKAIAARMPSTQSPNYFTVGAADTGFIKQKPFTVTTDATNAPVTSSLWVTGPESLSRSDAAPSFRVNPGPNIYFIVEVATDASLFDTANARTRRNSANFYGSWSDSSHFSGTEYTLPDAVWQRLKGADALYYRIGSTATSEGWTGYMVSTPDQQYANAPYISLSGASSTNSDTGTATGVPSIMGPASISVDDPAPSFDVDTAGAPYFIVEVATQSRLLSGTVPDEERTADKFYATWQDSSLQTGSTYDLPEEVWQRLRPIEALYYRVGTTTSESGWENYQVSTDDGDVDNAPWIDVSGG